MFSKKAVLKNVVEFTRKHVCQSFFLVGLRSATLLKDNESNLMVPNPQSPVDLDTFTEEILNGKLHFLCSVLLKI